MAVKRVSPSTPANISQRCWVRAPSSRNLTQTPASVVFAAATIWTASTAHARRASERKAYVITTRIARARSRMEYPRLHPEHAGVLTAIFQQFRVASLLDDSAIIDHGDAVRAANRGETVRNDDCGQARCQLEEAIEQLDFGAYIQVRGGFIQHQYVRTGLDRKQRTC